MQNIYNIPLTSIIFLDIETVPQEPSYEDLDEETQVLWNKKATYLSNEERAEDIYAKAGIYAEFGKIVCISCGLVTSNEGIRIKSFAGDDEKTLLSDFAQMLNKSFSSSNKYLCAHNGKEFDFPYIARRMLVNGIKLPSALQIAGKKPWEVPHLDTMELWKFGDYKNYTSLAILTKIFHIPTPKDDIDGSQVYKVYWNDNDLSRIVNYCQKDVVAIIQLFRKYRNETLIDPDNVSLID